MPVPEHRATVERHLLRDTAYSRLCDAIVAGTLMPGEQLHDGELCSWLGLSRTPVRDALSRLEDEGLVETAPQRYTRVTPLRLAFSSSQTGMRGFAAADVRAEFDAGKCIHVD